MNGRDPGAEMSMTDFERMLAAVLPARGRTSLTLTDVPSSDDGLMQILEKAIAFGNRSATRLTEIYLPMSEFPSMGASFWHVPVQDTGSRDVLRLVFEN
jgi:hypothetical protein